MVAEAVLITITIIGTEGFDSSVFFVFLQQERGIVDKDGVRFCCQEGAGQNVVNALPATLIAIGACRRLLQILS